MKILNLPKQKSSYLVSSLVMTKKEKEEKLENFRTWVTFIDDRVNDWKKKLPEDIAKQFDWSLKSLDQMEQYILSNYTCENVLLQENKEAIDAMASYIGETFRLNLPNARWNLELDDKRNIDFNIPTVCIQMVRCIEYIWNQQLQNEFWIKNYTTLSTEKNQSNCK